MSLDLDKLRKSGRHVTKFVKRNPKRPTTDAVHKLRTGVRHVETALQALELESKRGVGPLLRDLQKIKRLAGRLRDMDVLTSNAMEIDPRGEKDCLIRLVEHLGAERKRHARKLRAAIAKRPRRIRRSLESGLDRIERVAEDARRGNDPGAVPAALAHALQSSSQLRHPGRLTRNNLHAYRLKVKELRDILRLSAAADSALVGKLAEVKDAIGDWHDWLELTDIAAGVLDHGASCRLMKRLATTRDAKYRHALSSSRALIARHLQPRSHPVLEAVAGFAEEKG